MLKETKNASGNVDGLLQSDEKMEWVRTDFK